MNTLSLRVIVPNNPQFDLPSNPDGTLIGINIQSLVGASLPCWVQAFENMGGYTVQIHIQADIGLAPGPTPVWSALIPTGHQADLQVDVPRAMISEGTFELFAVVISPTSQNREETPRLNVKIDFQAPDGASLKPITARLANPGIITREDIQNGVTFEVEPYLNRRQFDTVRLELPGQKVFEHLLRDIPVEGSPVSFLVDAEFLTGFIGLMDAEVAYRVFDDVRNLSALSPSATFIVDANPNALPAPTFLDIPVGGGAIDLFRLDGPDTRVRVLNMGFTNGEWVTLHYQLHPDGGPIERGTVQMQMNSDVGNFIYRVPSNPSHVLRAGRLLVYYTDSQGRRSSMASVALTGQLSGMSFGSAYYSQRTTETYYVVKGRPPVNPPTKFNATYSRQPSGSVGLVTYTSSDRTVATVNGNGLVVAAGNGEATITAIDSRGARASYKIRFSRVRQVELAKNQNWEGGRGDPGRPEFTSLTRAQLSEFWEVYSGEDPNRSVPNIVGWTALEGSTNYWTADNDLNNANGYIVNFHAVSPDWFGQSIHGATKFPSVKWPAE